MGKQKQVKRSIKDWTVGFEFEFLTNRNAITKIIQAWNRNKAKKQRWDIGSDSTVYDGFDLDIYDTESRITIRNAHGAKCAFPAEVRSPPVTGNKAYATLCKGFSLIKKHGVTGSSCGLHVHMSHPEINPGNIDVLTMCAIHDEIRLLKLCGHVGKKRQIGESTNSPRYYHTDSAWAHIECHDVTNSENYNELAGYLVELCFDRVMPISFVDGCNRFELRGPGGQSYETKSKQVLKYIKHCAWVIEKAHMIHIDRIKMIKQWQKTMNKKKHRLSISLWG